MAVRETNQTRAQRVIWAKVELERLAAQGYFGKITFTIERGCITKAEKFEVVVPEKLASEG